MNGTEAAGMQTLTKILGQTMGPRGRYAQLARSFGPPVRTRKASTIASVLDLADVAEARGLAHLRDATQAVKRRQGDGTSSAAVLAEALTTEARDVSNLSAAVAEIATRMRAEAQPVSRHLAAFLAAQACGVAMPSMEAALTEVDPKSVEWTSIESPDAPRVSLSSGWVGEAAVLSPAFCTATDVESRRVELSSPLLFRVTGEEPFEDVLRALRQADEQDRAAVFIARRYSPELTSLLIQAQYTHQFVRVVGASLDTLPEDGRIIHDALAGRVPRVCAFVSSGTLPEASTCKRLIASRERLTLDGLPEGIPVAVVELRRDAPEFEGQCDVVDALHAAARGGVVEGGGRALARLAASEVPGLASALSRPRDLLGSEGEPMDAVDVVLGALEEAAKVVIASGRSA
jgi:hypothetical protein